ncbi:MAG: hypothetical protein ACNA7W_04275 [Pseudomonadales bacterium]
MPKRLAVLAQVLLLGLAGCATQPVRYDDDGTVTIRCAGGYHDWSGCFSRAEAACGSPGYEILSRVSNEGSDGVGSRDWSQAGSEVSRTLVVRCR